VNTLATGVSELVPRMAPRARRVPLAKSQLCRCLVSVPACFEVRNPSRPQGYTLAARTPGDEIDDAIRTAVFRVRANCPGFRKDGSASIDVVRPRQYATI
jgi:hypothetical protein